jgi:hypothetical protein
VSLCQYTHPFAVVEEATLPESIHSDWVIQKVKTCHVVGLSCEGFEAKMMALFTAIEASRQHIVLTSSPRSLSQTLNRGHRELNRIACSINYDNKGGHSSRGKKKGGVQLVLNES